MHQKIKIGDWFEAYASLLDAQYLNEYKNRQRQMKRCKCKSNPETEPKRRLEPHHVIMCTGRMRFPVTRTGLFLTDSLQGHSGEPRVQIFPVQNNFEGTLYHSSQHQDASLSCV